MLLIIIPTSFITLFLNKAWDIDIHKAIYTRINENISAHRYQKGLEQSGRITQVTVKQYFST